MYHFATELIYCVRGIGYRACRATVRVFNKGHSVGSSTVTYIATQSEATVGIIQILVHQLDKLCDLLLVKRQLPAVDQVDTLLSDVFQNDSVATAVPAVSFEKFLESYRFLRDTGSARFLYYWLDTPLTHLRLIKDP